MSFDLSVPSPSPPQDNGRTGPKGFILRDRNHLGRYHIWERLGRGRIKLAISFAVSVTTAFALDLLRHTNPARGDNLDDAGLTRMVRGRPRFEPQGRGH